MQESLTWLPVPRKEQNRFLWGGNLNTSPWMYFHPVSSWSSSTATTTAAQQVQMIHSLLTTGCTSLVLIE